MELKYVAERNTGMLETVPVGRSLKFVSFVSIRGREMALRAHECGRELGSAARACNAPFAA